MDPSRFSALQSFYKNYFIPAYADLVGFIADKPQQLLIEIENAFVHLMQCLNDDLDVTLQEDNLVKAQNHLFRVTLDCYKILWVKMSEEIDLINKDRTLRSLTLNISETKFLTLHKDFKMTARRARTEEISNVGIDPLKSLNSYAQTVKIGWEIMKSMDTEKQEKIRKMKRIIDLKYLVYSVVIAFVVGVVAGVTANHLYDHYISSSPARSCPVLSLK